MAGDLRVRLSAGLRTAVSTRNREAAAVLRSALAALDNASAVAEVGPADHGPTGRGAAGAGAADVDRRVLDDDEQEALLRSEIDDRVRAADRYDEAGHGDRAAALRREAVVLGAYLSG